MSQNKAKNIYINTKYQAYKNIKFTMVSTRPKLQGMQSSRKIHTIMRGNPEPTKISELVNKDIEKYYKLNPC